MISEDCLTVSIFTPYLPQSQPGTSNSSMLKPVVVYYYGGGYKTGWAGEGKADGGNMAARGDVVGVSVNYRLGVLELLATETLLNGSQATQDQIAALQWVQEHMYDLFPSYRSMCCYALVADPNSCTLSLQCRFRDIQGPARVINGT